MWLTLVVTLVGSGISGADVRHLPAVPAAATGSAGLPAPEVCSDDQGVLGPVTCTRITELLAADEQASTDEIAVLVVGSTGSESIERYATRVFNSWGVGKEGVDNGVLIVVAFDDRNMRIEVGDGLTTRLPDGQAREIVGGTMLPAFRSGEYRTGVLAGLDAVRSALGYQLDGSNRMTAIPQDAGYRAPIPSTGSVEPANSYSRSQESGSSGSDGNTGMWVLIIAIGAGVALLSYLFRGGGGGDDGSGGGSGRRSYRSLRSRSSSSRSSASSSRRSSFGGGRSSGGGASGRW